MQQAQLEERGFRFNGHMGDFARIAFVNLLLSILTLGIYSFWGSARARRYLWSHTRFMGEPLEWTGTGRELLLGFLVVLALVMLPLYGVSFLAQRALLRGEAGLAFAAFAVMGVAIFFLMGAARFRMLRYRLSRTLWRGIRGGSDDGGWRYGLQTLARSALLVVTAYLTLPGYNIRLWNARWRKMSFGPYPFRAEATTKGLYRRFWACVGLFFVGMILMAVAVGSLTAAGIDPQAGAYVVTALSYVVFGTIAILYAAVFARNALGGLSLGDLKFGFDASSMDWLRYMAGNVGLVLVTLGLGIVLLPYRHRQFLMAHLTVSGTIDPEELTQSTTRAPGEGEGLASAFEIGAI